MAKAIVDVTVTLKVAVDENILGISKSDFDEYDEYASECEDAAIEKAEAFVQGLVQSHPNEIRGADDIESEFFSFDGRLAFSSDDDDEED